MAGFFLIPLYTKLLTPSDYGNLFLLNSTYLVINLVAVGGFENSFSRWFFDNEDAKDRIKTTSSWFWSQVFINLLLVGLFVPFIPYFISKFTTALPNPLVTVFCFVLATFFYILPSVYINYMRVTQQAKKTVSFTISFSVTTTLLSIIFVVFMHMNVLGIGLALFLSNFIFTIVAAILLKKKTAISAYSRKRAWEMFKFSYPFIPALLSYWILQSTDSYFIKLLTHSSEQIGLFSLGLTIASSIYVFTSAFQQIWPSYIFNAYTTMKEDRFKKIFAFFFELYVVVYLFLQLNLTFFSYNIIAIFSSNAAFQPAYKVVGLISLNTIIYSYLSFAAMGMSIKKVSAPLGIALTISALVGVGLNFLFIPSLGFVGSALATILASAPVPVYVLLRSQKLYYFSLPSNKIMLLTGMAFLIVSWIVFYPTLLRGNWNDIFLKLSISLACGAVLASIYYRPVKNMIPVLSGTEAAQSESTMAVSEIELSDVTIKDLNS